MGKQSRRSKKNLKLAVATAFHSSLPLKSSRHTETTAASISTTSSSSNFDHGDDSTPRKLSNKPVMEASTDTPVKRMNDSMEEKSLPDRISSPSTVTTAATGGTDMFSNSSTSIDCRGSLPSSSSSLAELSSTEASDEQVQHQHQEHGYSRKMIDPCTCQTIQGDPHEINLFLPKCLPCICRQHLRTLEEQYEGHAPNPDELMNLQLEGIVRPWQSEFLQHVGIYTVSDLSRVYKLDGVALSHYMRKWCKRRKIWVANDEACFLALHIWTRTCQNLEHILNVTYDLTYPHKQPTMRLPAQFYGFTNGNNCAALPPHMTELPSFGIRTEIEDHQKYDALLAGDDDEQEEDHEYELSPDDEWWKIQPKIEQQLKELEEIEKRRQQRIAVEQALTFKDTRWEEFAELESLGETVTSASATTTSSASSHKSGFSFRLTKITRDDKKIMKSQSERGERKSASFRGLYDKVLKNLETEATDANEYSIYHKALKETRSHKSLSDNLSVNSSASHGSSNLHKSHVKSIDCNDSSCDSSQLSFLTTEDELSSTFCSSSGIEASTPIEEVSDDSDHSHDTLDYEVELLTSSQDPEKIHQKTLFTKGGRRRIYMEDLDDDGNDTDDLSITDDGNIIESLAALSSTNRKRHPWDSSLRNRASDHYQREQSDDTPTLLEVDRAEI